jgi:hypothetical protein
VHARAAARVLDTYVTGEVNMCVYTSEWTWVFTGMDTCVSVCLG